MIFTGLGRLGAGLALALPLEPASSSSSSLSALAASETNSRMDGHVNQCQCSHKGPWPRRWSLPPCRRCLFAWLQAGNGQDEELSSYVAVPTAAELEELLELLAWPSPSALAAAVAGSSASCTDASGGSNSNSTSSRGKACLERLITTPTAGTAAGGQVWVSSQTDLQTGRRAPRAKARGSTWQQGTQQLLRPTAR